jgi:2-phosphosulfolactate phosphatase
MATTLEVLFTPADFATLKQRDLSDSVCVVFDILRATSSMMMALSNGASAIIPVTEISEAIAIHKSRPEVLLAGERDGLRIRAEQTGSVDFDFGNSPREFMRENVAGKTIVMTTTNGTRALQACAGAKTVLIGSFLNLRPIANWIIERRPPNLILVCSGTGEQAALEDTLAAGALCEKIWVHYAGGNVADSAEIARRVYPLLQMDLVGAMNHSRNGHRLLSNPDLKYDVRFCVQRETLSFIAEYKDGVVRRMDLTTNGHESGE